MELFTATPQPAGRLSSLPIFITYAVHRHPRARRIAPLLPHTPSTRIHTEEFEISTEVTDDTRFVFCDSVYEPGGTLMWGDAHALRQAFEQVRSRSQFLDFFANCGDFFPLQLTPAPPQDGLSFNAFKAWQALFSKAKLDGYLGMGPGDAYPGFSTKASVKFSLDPLFSIDSNLGRDPAFSSFLPTPQHPVAFITVDSAVQAIAASIKMDFLRSLSFQKCAHCDVVFAPGSRRDRIFCSKTCQNVVMQRRYRAADRSVA